MNGFLLIDKDKNMTSHDVLMKLKKQLKINKIGHTGTLDPFATGLLICCLGDACKLSNTFINMDKSYEGTLIFGKLYDTLDITGKIESETNNLVSMNHLNEAVDKLLLTKTQMPPIYSAIKVDGKKLYEYARKGKTVIVEPRNITIDSFKIVKQLNDNEFTFETSVSKGTYIRAIARDLGELVDNYGSLSQLRRTRIGNYFIKDSSKLDNINLDLSFISLKTYLSSYESIVLSPYLISLVKNGVVLDERQITTNNPFIVKDEHNNIIALYDVVSLNRYKPVLILKE